MRKTQPIALVCVSCIVLGQDQRSGWTDKNNWQMYTAYILRGTYGERGYLSAKVDVKRSGEEDVFVDEPVPVFHFKEFKIVGLSENLVQQIMKDAPKAGEVYSDARLLDWREQAGKQIVMSNGIQKFAGEEVRLDRGAFSVNVTILFKVVFSEISDACSFKWRTREGSFLRGD